MGSTWDTIKTCFAILRDDEKLFWFPVLSTLCCLIALAPFAYPFYAYIPHEENATLTQQQELIVFVLSFLYYFINSVIITYFNTALIACIMQTIRQGSTTIDYGFQEANQRLHLIFGWALLMTTVGTILRAIENRSKLMGKIVARFLDVAFNIASFFVVPVMVVENKSPLDALMKSAELFKKTWGTRLKANIGFGVIYIVVLFAIVIACTVLASSLKDVIHPATFFILGAGGVVVSILVLSMVETIFKAALYLYCAEGLVVGGFDRQTLQSAYTIK